MNFFNEEKNEIFSIFNRIRKKDFSGNAGQAVKNSIFQILTNITTKIGAFIFTIILARILLPELFGAYSVALATILIFVAFSDLGLGQTIVRFVSKEWAKGDSIKAKSYLNYISKIKISLAFFLCLVLLLFAKFISEDYYHKPIYLSLLAGIAYVFFVSLVSMMQSFLQARNLFKSIFLREFIFQTVRIILIPLLIIGLLKNAAGDEMILFAIISGLAFTYFLSGLFLFFSKKIKIFSTLVGGNSLSRLEKKEVKRFFLFMSATSLSGVFFGYIDIIMLGKFVSSEYIGYYTAAFNFIGALVPLITFSTALLPIFTGLNKDKLELFFKKSLRLSFFFSLIGAFILLSFSQLLISIIFGAEYSPSSNVLRIFSLLLIVSPIIELYSTYFTAIGKPVWITKSLVISTIMNICLNYLFISTLIIYGQIYAIYGATIATIISRFYYMFSLIWSKKKIQG
jgi:PST family polysaccharide transporter